ncbi:MAG: hemerythrin family protein [Magnetococcales bacterium]|nr:hemerythrin family protein [Magnetococcales bacterium]
MGNLSVSDVGVEQFNKDHQRLLFYVQEFTRLCSRFRLRTPFPDEWDQVDAIFSRLEKYTSSHFKDEELALANIDYPTLAKHLEQHQLLVNMLAELKVKVKNREFQAIGAVKMFLVEWVTNHINHVDTQYKPFMTSTPS